VKFLSKIVLAAAILAFCGCAPQKALILVVPVKPQPVPDQNPWRLASLPTSRDVSHKASFTRAVQPTLNVSASTVIRDNFVSRETVTDSPRQRDLIQQTED
jgi:uncharacterized lipoprotein YajG